MMEIRTNRQALRQARVNQALAAVEGEAGAVAAVVAVMIHGESFAVEEKTMKTT